MCYIMTCKNLELLKELSRKFDVLEEGYVELKRKNEVLEKELVEVRGQA